MVGHTNRPNRQTEILLTYIDTGWSTILILGGGEGGVREN